MFVVLCLTYSMTSTLNDDSSTNKINFWKMIVEMFQRYQHDYNLIDRCFHKTFDFHVNRSFSKQEKLMFKETETLIF